MIPLRDSVRPRRRPFVNWLLILINFLVFFHELGLTQRQLNRVFYALGVVPAKVFYLLKVGAPVEVLALPFFTDMFLHGGWIHILGNMLFLWVFGDNV